MREARPGIIRTFTKQGELLGETGFRDMTPQAPRETRALDEQAVAAAIDACTPLSEALGKPLAGSPKVVPFIDRRK